MSEHAALRYAGAVTAATRAKGEEVLDALKAARGKTLNHVWGYDPNPKNTEHHSKRALDFMVHSDRAAGDWIADYLWKHRVRLGVRHIIWQQRIISTVVQPGVWRKMADRGSTTNNHMDHPHVLFNSGAYVPLKGAPAKAPTTSKPSTSKGSTPPAFPLPRGWYFGPRSGPRYSVSGAFGYRADLRRWQQRMKDRGWSITADGLYGPKTARVAIAFQKEKGLRPIDGLIGRVTWDAAWKEPVT